MLLLCQHCHFIAKLSKHEEHVDVIVLEGAIPSLVQNLQAPLGCEGEGHIVYEYKVKKEAAFALGLLPMKLEHQKIITDASSHFGHVSLLKWNRNDSDNHILIGAL